MKKSRNEKIGYSHSIKLFSFFVILVLFLSSCAFFPGSDKDKAGLEENQVSELSKEKHKLTPAHITTLSKRAEYFIRNKNYVEALAIYELLLSRTEEKQKTAVISRLEKVLAQIPSSVLQKWSKKEVTYIPDPLMIYSIGFKYAIENHPKEAEKTLEVFKSKYPNHYLYNKALDTLHMVRKTIVSKRTLGCLLPLSGRYAVLGKRALTGVQLALDNLSKKYSTEFKVVFFDTKSDPQTAIEGVKYLHQQNVIGILGPLSARYEIIREVENLKIPMIALTQKQDFSLQGDYLFTNFITPEMQIQALGAYLFPMLGNTRAVILYPDEKYGSRYMELFRTMAEEYEVEILSVKSYDGTQTDFSETILELKDDLETWYFSQEELFELAADNGNIDAHAEKELAALLIPSKKQKAKQDTEESEVKEVKEGEEGEEEEEEEIIVDCQVIFIPDSPSRVNLILPQLAFNDIGGMYIAGTNLWHDKSLLEGSKGYHRTAVIPDGFFDKSQYPETQKFVKNYKNTFNTAPQFIEAISYDTARILLTTAMDETVRSRDDLKNALKANRIYNGVTGPGKFDENGLVQKPLFMLTIENDEFVELNR
ncbi:MAG: penicillin-binding protein activator [Desulfobacula sp.]|nr:penicillin-binding protein activator [Desulfobacula sp.]